MIEVLHPGFLTTVQDPGRPGFQHWGVPPGGAADWFSAEVVNRLVGNDRDAAVLEVTNPGTRLRFHQDCTIAIAGSGALEVRPVADGETLGLSEISPGLRAYIAVRGGIDVPVVMGSRSLCARGMFGGGFGRPLQKGDQFRIGDMIRTEPAARAWPPDHRPPIKGPWELRVIPGPHTDAFEPDALARLCATACRATPAMDRMGVRIETPSLRLPADEILTTPMVPGSLQVTPSGELIALLVDHPTTGGYPVIATVIHADIPQLAQVRPGDTIRFRAVDLAEAASALRRLTEWLDDV